MFICLAERSSWAISVSPRVSLKEHKAHSLKLKRWEHYSTVHRSLSNRPFITMKKLIYGETINLRF